MAALADTSSLATGPQLDNRRIAAALIDLVIPLVALAVAYGVGLSLTLGLILVGVGWTLYYFFALESGDGQTLGKRVMKLRVMSADGTPATMEQIAKRTVVRILDGPLVGLIAMLATGERRLRLGDIVAGTVVADAQGAAAGGPAPKAAVAPKPAPAKRSLFSRELSIPSFRRPGKTAAAAAAPPLAEPPGAKKPSLLKRDLSLPSLRRPKKPKAPRAAATGPGTPTGPKAAKRSLLKRDLSLPSLRRRARAADAGSGDLRQTASPGPGAQIAPGLPGPDRVAPGLPETPADPPSDRLSEALRAAAAAVETPAPPAHEPYSAAGEGLAEPSVELDAPEPDVDFDGPEPSVEFDAPEPSVEFDTPEPSVEFDAPEPDVEFDTPEPDVELDAPEPSAQSDDPGPSVELDAPEEDDEEPEVTIKPIETISPLDLLMEDAEERRPGAE